MQNERLYVFGAGGHSKVVIEAMRARENSQREICVYDDDPARVGSFILSHEVRLSAPVASVDCFHVAIGSNSIREARFIDISRHGARYLHIIHPRASIASSARAGEGALVAAMAILGPDSHVGAGTIINHGAIVDHDCVVGRFCHVAPRAVLSGGVKLGDRVFLGAGATVLPGLSIASDVTIGAGAVVTKSIDQAGVTIGDPTKTPLAPSLNPSERKIRNEPIDTY